MKRQLARIAALLAAACVIALAYLLASHRANAYLQEQGQHQLQLMAPDLESMLEKYETLPFVLGFQYEVTQALARPDDAQLLERLNRNLQTIQRQAKVSAIYVLAPNGTTLASSNWDEAGSFVAKNFDYRPYFREAMNGKAGRFYGIGSATNEAGYFIAQPVAARGAVIGVVVVKISLAEFEQTWNSSDTPIVLADRNGVVFLSNRAAWKYRSLQPLSEQMQRELASTKQFAGRLVAPIGSLAPAVREGFGPYVKQAVGRLGWQLMLFPSVSRVTGVATLWALATALVLACGATLTWAVHQRRRRLEERLVSRQALLQAALDLDVKLEQRTQELSLTNQHLETRYAKLKETEHLLRSTQNELVQAGKLAMLGQMAAGMTHELNQPLAAIRAFADNARTFLERGQEQQAHANLDHISNASARMGAIIGQLKGFARKSDTVAAVDIRQSIESSAILLQSEFRRHEAILDIIEDGAREAVRVVGNAVRIEQVLINLLRNALDAVESAAQRKVMLTLAREHGAAVVRIRDSGNGIPALVAPQLFEPFFTTKPPGKGLGLGLAISSSIVQAMNGQLTAHNHADGGAEFVVRLPLYVEGECFVGAANDSD